MSSAARLPWPSMPRRLTLQTCLRWLVSLSITNNGNTSNDHGTLSLSHTWEEAAAEGRRKQRQIERGGSLSPRVAWWCPGLLWAVVAGTYICVKSPVRYSTDGAAPVTLSHPPAQLCNHVIMPQASATACTSKHEQQQQQQQQ